MLFPKDNPNFSTKKNQSPNWSITAKNVAYFYSLELILLENTP
jgi:hypothetical protein